MFHRPILAWAAVGWLAAAGALARPADFDAAIALYDAGKYSAAQRIFEQIAAREPDNPEVNFRLGSIALWFDDAGRGRELLEKAVRAKPDDARYQSALGNAYGLTAQKAVFFTKFGWARKCRTAYLRAVKLEPENPEWHWSLLGYFMQAPGIAGGGIDKAYAEAAIIRKLSGAEGRIAFATLDLAEEKYDEAFREFDEVLRVSPDDFVALYQIGRCSALSGRRWSGAFSCCRRRARTSRRMPTSTIGWETSSKKWAMPPRPGPNTPLLSRRILICGRTRTR